MFLILMSTGGTTPWGGAYDRTHTVGIQASSHGRHLEERRFFYTRRAGGGRFL